MTPRGSASVILCSAALALLAGCGSSDEGDRSVPAGGATAPAAGGRDEQALRDTIEAYYGAFQKPAEFCGFLSKHLSETNGGGDAEAGRKQCEQGQERYAKAGATREVEEIERVRVTGPKATADVKVSLGSPQLSGRRTGGVTQGWVLESGKWKLDSSTETSR